MKPESHILFEKHLTELGLKFESEAKFHQTRKWRWDFTLPEHSIAIEIQGGFYRGTGGHNSINGMQRDMDKRNHGAMHGWKVLTFSSADVLRGKAKEFLAEHVK